jgi:DNA repair exonuclease SbcCD nuclease subunit
VRQQYADLARKGCEYVVGHLGIGDPRFANCVPVDYEVTCRISVDDLCPDRFTQVFLGHYHLRQTLLPNVRYVGSPLQLSFGEAFHEKGWLVVDHDDGSVREVVNTSSPEYHVVTDVSVLPDVPERDFVWVRAASREDEEAAAEATRGRPGVRIDRAPAPGEPPRIDTSARGADLLRAYVKAVQPDLLASEVEDLVVAGLRFFQERKP